MIVTNCLEEYFSLMQTRPELFTASEEYPIETNKSIIQKYQNENHVKIGVLYKSLYHMLIVDLIKKNNTYFTYERLIPVAKNKGIVCVPFINNKLILIKQQRHAIRDTQICFPRGFGENNFSPLENARKELFEELGLIADDYSYLGTIIPDSGINAANCDIFLCRINGEKDILHLTEGIIETIFVNFNELEQMINNNLINDSFTLSAFSFLKVKNIFD